MAEHEAQHRREQGRIAGTGAQVRGREAGEREQPVGAHGIAQHPAQSGEADNFRVGWVCTLAQHRLNHCPDKPLGQVVTKRVLVVEDNELNLKLFCDLLAAHGYEAEPVRDGREALERARAFKPDVVIMDIQLPHVSGLELIAAFKADPVLAPVPIMAVTAYAAKSDEERIRAAGAERYVSKPISVARFIDEVAALA